MGCVPIFFRKEPEEVVKQKTISKTAKIEGVGLQTGAKVRMVLKPSPADSGINFIRTDLPGKPFLNIQTLDFSDPALMSTKRAEALRRTTLGAGLFKVQTTEHFLAALGAFSIDNIVVEIDNAELPGMDGSAIGYVEALKKTGITEQGASKGVITVKEPVWCESQDSFIAVFPDGNFKISYTLSYKDMSIGTQFLTITLDEKTFEKDIAPARTFCLEGEALQLLRSGLGKGANYENTLVMGKTGPINNRLRFPDEPVRHKVLDLAGDLYLLGMPLKGHIVAIKSGHRLNMELVRKLKAMKPVTSNP